MSGCYYYASNHLPYDSLTQSPFLWGGGIGVDFVHLLIFKNKAFRKPAVVPSSGEKAPNLLDPLCASLSEDGNRAGFRKLEYKKVPPSKKKEETVIKSYTIVKAM